MKSIFSSQSNNSLPRVNGTRKHKRMLDSARLLAVIVCGAIAVRWILSDITGEYTSMDPKLGIVRMSLIRRATIITGELFCGHGANLEATVPEPDQDNKLDIIFELPEKWMEKGQPYRKVEFHGRIHDGIATGVLQEKGKVYTIKLERDALSSLYRLIQSHLPWLD